MLHLGLQRPCREDKSGDLLLKIVNTAAQAQPLPLDIHGARFAEAASGQRLSGAPTDVNTLQNPLQVAPKTFTIRSVAGRFAPQIPAHFVSAIRFKAR